ncbi:MAG: transposase [Candidatus Aminicenantia bacterium]
MSDNLRRFSAIKKALKNLYPGEPKGNLARRLHTLAAMINGIVGGKSTNLPKIASKNVDNNKDESRVKSYARWLQNKYVNFKIFFLPFLEILIDSLCNQTLVLAIDSSVIGRGCMCLMINLIYKNRALPLCWIVVKQQKGHLLENIHIHLLKIVEQIIPSDANVVLLGDGEFDGIDFQKLITGYGWKYVCRTAKNTVLYENGEEFSFDVVRPTSEWGEDFFSIPNVKFTKEQYGPVHAIVWWKKGYKEPVFLITNIELAQEACYYYKKRFKIETFFSDQKSRGFNIDKSHISDPERLSRLLIPACLAYIWIVYLGTFAMNKKLYSIIHRTNRCDLSLFQLGLRLLEYFLNQMKIIPVNFCMLEFENPFG